MQANAMSGNVSHASSDRIFNDDLLTNAGDLKYASDQFPRVFPILDHPELRSMFVKYERVANTAHLWVHWLGLLAVIFATIVLLSAAAEPLWGGTTWANRITIAFEFCGLFAALVAGGSLWLGPWRKRWLESRFMTERLRHWHFQLLVRKGREIERLLTQATETAAETFKNERKKWFDNFLHEYEGKLGSRMDSLASDPDFSSDWLHNPTSLTDGSVFDDVVEVYSRLRFNHQYDYSTYKLSASTDRPFWLFLKWPLLRQSAAIRTAVSFCFVAAFLCSVAVITNRYFAIRPSLNPYLGSATLVVAILGVALRTIQEGLGIAKDIERYRDYRGKVRRLFLCFEETTDQHKKLRLMEEMELAGVDELRGFLRAHSEAAFIL